MAAPWPEIAIVVPVLNEARWIDACLRSLLQQDAGGDYAIMVVDGGSTDGTLASVAEWARRDPRITAHHNPHRRQAAAFNLAARIADPGVRVLVRADAHAAYPPNFLRHCVTSLATRNATSVVVPMHTVGTCAFQRAAAAAQNSRLGNGGSAHRSAGVSRFVDHGHHAAFDRAFFTAVGGYDTRFSHNEDAEHDIRAHAVGGRIWLCAEAAVTYYPRDSMRGLAIQYYRHGRGRARTLRLHAIRPRVRQMIPVAVLGGVAFGVVLSSVSPWFMLLPASYAAVCAGWSAWRAAAARDPALLLSAPALMAMHLAWACGAIRETLASRLRPNHRHSPQEG